MQWDDDEVCFVLDQHAELDFYSANQSLLFPPNAACLAQKQQIPILVIGMSRLGLEPMIYSIRGEQANHYTTDVVHVYSRKWVVVQVRSKQRL